MNPNLNYKPLADRCAESEKITVYLGACTHYLDPDEADRLVEAVRAAQARQRYFAVSGRKPGDDEDVTHIFQAATRDEAVKQFENALWDNNPEEIRESTIKRYDCCVYINSVVESDSEIKESEIAW